MVSIYNYTGVPVYWPLSVLCVCVCVISNQSTSKKKTHYVSELSKIDALWPKIHIKILLVLKFQGWTCVDPYYP